MINTQSIGEKLRENMQIINILAEKQKKWKNIELCAVLTIQKAALKYIFCPDIDKTGINKLPRIMRKDAQLLFEDMQRMC